MKHTFQHTIKMKTSNKLLLITGLVLMAAAIAYAIAIKAKFEDMTNKPIVLETFPVDTLTEVEIRGTAPRGLNLQATLSYHERTEVRYTDHDFIRMEREGTRLKITIAHPKGYSSAITRRPEIFISSPVLQRVAIHGTPLDSLDLPPDAHVLTRNHYSKSEVDVKGYHGPQLAVYASNGAKLTLSGMKIDSLDAHAAESGILVIHGNSFGDARLKVGKQGKAEVRGPQVGTLYTDVDLDGELVMKGTDLVIKNGQYH